MLEQAGAKREMGEAQQSTADRNAILDELEAWLADFYGVAKLALRDKPDSLQKMGL